MPLYFRVTVEPQKVVVQELEKPFNSVHVRARVDGEYYVYQLKKGKNIQPYNRTWFERGMTQAYYHAKNSGNVTTFTPVLAQPKRGKKIDYRQNAIF